METTRVKDTLKSTITGSGATSEIQNGAGTLKRWCAGALTVENLCQQSISCDPMIAPCGSMKLPAMDRRVICGTVYILVGVSALSGRMI